MSAAAIEIGKKAVENVAKIDMKGALGMGRKIVGARWKQAATRQGRQALMSRAAVGAIGGGAYGYTQGDWKGGAMMGAGAGAGAYMLGGRAGMRAMGRKFTGSTARAAEKKIVGQQVGRQVSKQVSGTQMFTGDAMVGSSRVGKHPGSYRPSAASFAAADSGSVYSRASVMNGSPKVNGAASMNEALSNQSLYNRSGNVVTNGSHPGMGLRQRIRNGLGRFNTTMTT